MTPRRTTETSVVDRFWARVDKNGPIPGYRPELGPCWLWTGYCDQEGYGRHNLSHGRPVLAHRESYRQIEGEIPAGLELDHLCRVRHCVNPEHLEPVTHAENMRRGMGGKRHAEKTHCPKGHPYDASNTAPRGRNRSGRNCKTCKAVWARARRGNRTPEPLRLLDSPALWNGLDDQPRSIAPKLDRRYGRRHCPCCGGAPLFYGMAGAHALMSGCERRVRAWVSEHPGMEAA